MQNKRWGRRRTAHGERRLLAEQEIDKNLIKLKQNDKNWLDHGASFESLKKRKKRASP